MRPYLSAHPEGIVLSVWVQPRAARTRLAGEHGGALKIQVAALPADGAANGALVEFLSDLFGVPKRSVVILAGRAGRLKRVMVRGVEPRAVQAALEQVL